MMRKNPMGRQKMIINPKEHPAFKILVSTSYFSKQKRYVKCKISYGGKKRANRAFFPFLLKRMKKFKIVLKIEL